MIAEFKVKNFLSIGDELCLDFRVDPTKIDEFGDISEVPEMYYHEMKDGTRLWKTAMLCGPLSAGKTNILRALRTFARLLSPADEDESDVTCVSPFAFHSKSSPETTDFSMTFYLLNTKYQLCFSIDSQVVRSESLVMYIDSGSVVVYDRKYNKKTGEVEVEFLEELMLDQKNRQLILSHLSPSRTVMAAYVLSDAEHPLLTGIYYYLDLKIPNANMTPEVVNERLVATIGNKRMKSLKKFMLGVLSVFDMNIVDIKIRKSVEDIPDLVKNLFDALPDELKTEMDQQIAEEGTMALEDVFFVYKTAHRKYSQSVSNASTGTLRLLSLCILFYQLSLINTVTLINDIDEGLPPFIIDYLLREFLEHNPDKASQLIFTSHQNPFEGPLFAWRDACWIVYKDEKAQTKLLPLTCKTFEEHYHWFHLK